MLPRRGSRHGHAVALCGPQDDVRCIVPHWRSCTVAPVAWGGGSGDMGTLIGGMGMCGPAADLFGKLPPSPCLPATPLRRGGR